ncbi:hypothetical protein [Streptomyces sp. NPDC054797]
MRAVVRAAGMGSGPSADAGIAARSSPCAADLATLARAAAGIRPAGRERPADLVILAAVLARVPDLQRALDVVRLLHGPAEQAPAWLAVVRETAAGGDHTAALALVEAMKHRPSRAEAAGMLAQVRARNGEHEQARALAETIPYPHARLLAWAMLAQAAADSGDHPWTLEFLDRAEQVETGHDEWTAPAIPVLIRAAAAVGDRDRTLAWIERLEEVARRESAARTALRAGRDESPSKTSPLSDTPTLQPLLRTVAGVGEHERTKALLKSVRDKAPRAVATAAAARACAQYGDRVRALRLARSIEDPAHRAGALAAVADAAARAGDVDMINAGFGRPRPGLRPAGRKLRSPVRRRVRAG